MNNLITILGVTATGKTRLAVELASMINGEIISGDSRQVYKDMNMGDMNMVLGKILMSTHSMEFQFLITLLILLILVMNTMFMSFIVISIMLTMTSSQEKKCPLCAVEVDFTWMRL